MEADVARISSDTLNKARDELAYRLDVCPILTLIQCRNMGINAPDQVSSSSIDRSSKLEGMTKKVFVKVDWLENSPSSGITLQYFLFSINSIRLFGGCVHYKKLIVHTAKNKMYSLVLAPLDLARSDLEDAWKSWMKAACILHRTETNTSINENQSIKGHFELESDQQNPFIDAPLVEVEMESVRDSCSIWLLLAVDFRVLLVPSSALVRVVAIFVRRRELTFERGGQRKR
ncbi:hypothetical protein TNCV_2824021 [Trichonephila clavipes]|nr:hypothetical protein TNCV_2824021 [Trichonephila clavipes]